MEHIKMLNTVQPPSFVQYELLVHKGRYIQVTARVAPCVSSPTSVHVTLRFITFYFHLFAFNVPASNHIQRDTGSVRKCKSTD
jgi:hypothetical protein